jgi:hypothetical protein
MGREKWANPDLHGCTPLSIQTSIEMWIKLRIGKEDALWEMITTLKEHLHMPVPFDTVRE